MILNIYNITFLQPETKIVGFWDAIVLSELFSIEKF